MISPSTVRRHAAMVWLFAGTVVVEAITLALRFGTGITATEFNRAAPLVLQIHHMFWSLPLLAGLPLVWRWPQVSGAVLGIAGAFVASDLIHHFVVLPLFTGTTGWHWP